MDDDRIRCRDCRQLKSNGMCRVLSYCPSGSTLRRCEHYSPRKDVEDQRTGAERNWTESNLSGILSSLDLPDVTK